MQRLTNEDLFRYRFLSEATWSTNGTRAAFAVRSANEKQDGYTSDLWLYDGACRQLTAGGDAGSFLWEDDNTILFSCARNEAHKERLKAGEKLTDYYRIDVRGGEARYAFCVPLAVGDIQRLPNGDYAVIAAYRAGDIDFSAANEADKDAFLKHIEAEKDYEVLEEIPFWSNGGGFTNGQRARLYVFSPETGKAAPITDETTLVSQLFVGKERVLFAAENFVGKMALTSGLYAYSPATGAVETLLAGGRYMMDWVGELNGEPVFIGVSPEEGLRDMRLTSQLYRVADGVATVISDTDENAGETIGTDCALGGGTLICARESGVYYTAVSHTKTALRRVKPDGTAETLLLRAGSIDCFDVNDKGDVLYIGMTGTTLQELYLLGDDAPKSELNAWLNREKSISPLIELHAESDGLEIEGFCIEPVGREDGKTYPAIFDIHGGPKCAYGDAFYHEMQVWANDGYYVFFCNPRGGDGRGAAFADIRGQYGTIDYEDLMRFADAALKAYPQIDPARVGVTGGSYGGFMTNWIIGHTNRFAAAVSQRSISNWTSMFLTTDIGYFFADMDMRATPWDNPEKLRFHSPVQYADKVETPTLFIHSDEDYRCWMAEGLQMYTSLRYHGVPARLCLFHGETHELSRGGKPKHRLRRLTEMQTWFNRYLKPAAQ